MRGGRTIDAGVGCRSHRSATLSFSSLSLRGASAVRQGQEVATAVMLRRRHARCPEAGTASREGASSRAYRKWYNTERGARTRRRGRAEGGASRAPVVLHRVHLVNGVLVGVLPRPVHLARVLPLEHLLQHHVLIRRRHRSELRAARPRRGRGGGAAGARKTTSGTATDGRRSIESTPQHREREVKPPRAKTRNPSIDVGGACCEVFLFPCGSFPADCALRPRCRAASGRCVRALRQGAASGL